MSMVVPGAVKVGREVELPGEFFEVDASVLPGVVLAQVRGSVL